MKTFLFCYSQQFGTRETVTKWLDKQVFIQNWVSPPIPNMVIITADVGPVAISDSIRRDFPGYHFIVSEIENVRSDGWMHPLAWKHIQTPFRAGNPPKN